MRVWGVLSAWHKKHGRITIFPEMYRVIKCLSMSSSVIHPYKNNKPKYCSDECREEGLRRYYKDIWQKQKAEKEKEKKWIDSHKRIDNHKWVLMYLCHGCKLRRWFVEIFFLAAWAAFSFFLSHQNGEATGRESRELAEKFRFTQINRMLRTSAHIILYFILGLLWIWCFGINTLILIPVSLAWLDESTKPLIPGRHYSLAEACLNILVWCLP